jgi:hypothetical protein
MSDMTTAMLGNWRPHEELRKETPYTNDTTFRRWLVSLGVPIVHIRRVPHSRPTDIQQALERLAERSIDTTPRRRGRPRMTAPQAA